MKLDRDELVSFIASLDDPQERSAAIAIHEDLEYFRTKPAKNWRIRTLFANEAVLLDGRISLEHSRALVFRNRSQGFFKALVTAGPHNDLLDPWIYVPQVCGADRRPGAIRASTAWKLFQQESTASQFLDTLGATVTADFVVWCAEDITRTARLSQSMFDADPEANPPGSREALKAGAEAWARWDEKRTTLVPDVALVERVKLRAKLNGSSPITPSDPTLVCLMSPDEGVHGYLFHVCDTWLQVGELLVDGRISFVEIRLNNASWNKLPPLFRNDAIARPDACTAALGVLMAYADHLNCGGKASQYIGMEILPSIQSLKERLAARKPKEPPMVMQPKKSNPLEAAIAQITAAYDARIAAHTKRLAEFRLAVNEGIDTYASAAEQDLLVDFSIRNGVENAGELRAGPAAEHLLELIGRLPELGGKERVETPSYRVTIPDAVVQVEIEEAPALGEFSKIQSLLNGGAEFFIVGGTPVKEKLAWLKDGLGLPVAWINTENDPDSRGCSRVADRMNPGGTADVAGVLFCHAFMSHVQTETLIKAGRAHNVPVAACGRAGKGEILRALRAVEKGL